MHERVKPTETTTLPTRDANTHKVVSKGGQNIKIIRAELTKLNCQEAAKMLPKHLYEKFSKSHQVLAPSKVKPSLNPNESCSIFESCGEAGWVRSDKLYENRYPAGRYFVLTLLARRKMKIATNQRLHERAVWALKCVGIASIENFDACESGMCLKRVGESENDKRIRTLEAAVHRLQRNESKARSQ